MYNYPATEHSTGSIYALPFNWVTPDWKTPFYYQGPGCPPCTYENVVSNVAFADGFFWVANYINFTMMTSSDGLQWETTSFPSGLTPDPYGLTNVNDCMYCSV